VSRHLDAIGLKCLEKDPRRRYPSAADLAADLDLWLREGWARATPGRLQRAVRAARKYAVAWIVAGVVGAAIGAMNWFDPDRPIRAIERKLDRGEEVTLIGEGVKEPWFRVRTGDDKSRVQVNPDGTLTVTTWSLCLVELVRDPCRDHVHFRVSIRHTESDIQGTVGSYVAAQAVPAASPEGHGFVGLTFNDIRSAAYVAALAPPRIPAKLPVPAENRVRLGFGGVVPAIRAEVIAWDNVAGAPFIPRGTLPNAPTVWRDLELDVYPTGVAGRRDGTGVGFLPADRFRLAFADRLGNWAIQDPTNPVWGQPAPAYTPRGGLGVLVLRGSATFRSAVVAPAADE
jgi:serine/threonine-protein kinase